MVVVKSCRARRSLGFSQGRGRSSSTIHAWRRVTACREELRRHSSNGGGGAKILIQQSGNATGACNSVRMRSGVVMCSSSYDNALVKVSEVSDKVATLFPLFVAVASTLALWSPPIFSWFGGNLLILGLTFTMLSMGTTLTPRELLRAAGSTKAIVCGFLLQYTVMPTLGFAISRMAGLSADHTAGLILVSCCPGGVASNVVCYIAKANVPLSVALTSVSTLAATVMTPILTSALLGQTVAVDAWGLFASTLKVVLIPVAMGSMLTAYCPRAMKGLSALAPMVSVIAVVFINASVVAQSSASILETGAKLALSCCLLHTGGFTLGYLLAKLLGFDESVARTMSIEVGMQNSTLGAFLAAKHFSIVAAAPCAVSAVFHSGIGSLMAFLWGKLAPVAVDEGGKSFDNAM